MSTWQPIETAPRPTSKLGPPVLILLKKPYDGMHQLVLRWSAAGWGMPGVCFGKNCALAWMPLPQPPSAWLFDPLWIELWRVCDGP